MGRLLAQAAAAAPVSTKFFQAVAEQMVLVDSSLFGGKYAEALTTAFVRRGLMSVRSLAAPDAVGATPARAAAAAARFSAAAAGRAPRRAASTSDTPVEVAIDGAALGLAVKTVYVNAPPVDDVSAPPVSMMAGVAARETLVMPRITDVQAFVEALIVRGRVSLPAASGPPPRARREPLAGTQARDALSQRETRRSARTEANRLRVLLTGGHGTIHPEVVP